MFPILFLIWIFCFIQIQSRKPQTTEISKDKKRGKLCARARSFQYHRKNKKNREKRSQLRENIYENALERSENPNIENQNIISYTDEHNPLAITLDEIDEFLNMNDFGLMKSGPNETNNELHGSQLETNLKGNLKDDTDPFISPENQDKIIRDNTPENKFEHHEEVRNEKIRKRKAREYEKYQSKRLPKRKKAEKHEDINLGEHVRNIRELFPGYNPYYGYTGMSSLANLNIDGIPKILDEEKEVSLENYNPDEILLVQDGPQSSETLLENQPVDIENHETNYNVFTPRKLVFFVSRIIPDKLTNNAEESIEKPRFELKRIPQ